MKEIVKQACPLCSSAAEYYLVDRGRRKYFECSECTLFQITVRAEDVLGNSPQHWRDRYAAAARSVPVEHALVISVPTASQDRSAPTAALSAEVVPWSELPQ